MHTIYKSPQGRAQVLALYDKQLQKLQLPYRDLEVSTSFGKTHLIETGNPQGAPLLVFHGGNATTAYNLLACPFLLKDFHIYAADTIGHPGKSAETCLSPRGDAYGRWGSQVISALGFERIRCFGGSFGAGVLVKTMCAAPEKIEKAVLYVPSGIRNAPGFYSMRMFAPICAYWLTHKRAWLEKAVLCMALTPDNLDRDTMETVACTIDNVKIKTGMPSNVDPARLKKCACPVYILAAEKDCLFPARLVLPRAEKTLPHVAACLLKGRGHMNRLTQQEQESIVRFLR